jgi:hypothetical protein
VIRSTVRGIQGAITLILSTHSLLAMHHVSKLLPEVDLSQMGCERISKKGIINPDILLRSEGRFLNVRPYRSTRI